MKVLQFGCILAFCSLQIFAIDFYITNPYSVTKWKQDQNVKITWNLMPGGEDISSISVDLMDGDDNNASLIANIASYLPSDSTSFEWYIPCTIMPSNTYFIRLSGNGKTTFYRFSHRFIIEKGCQWDLSSVTSVTTAWVSVSKSFSVTTFSTSDVLETSTKTTDESVLTTTTTMVAGSSKSNSLEGILVVFSLILLLLMN